jgi:hypothetical protein
MVKERGYVRTSDRDRDGGMQITSDIIVTPRWNSWRPRSLPATAAWLINRLMAWWRPSSTRGRDWRRQRVAPIRAARGRSSESSLSPSDDAGVTVDIAKVMEMASMAQGNELGTCGHAALFCRGKQKNWHDEAALSPPTQELEDDRSELAAAPRWSSPMRRKDSASYTRPVEKVMVRKRFRFWHKPSPNCGFTGLSHRPLWLTGGFGVRGTEDENWVINVFKSFDLYSIDKLFLQIFGGGSISQFF